VIQIYRPSREIEDKLGPYGQVSLTHAGLLDGHVQIDFQLNGRPQSFSEDPNSALRALRVTGATLANVELRNGSVWYALAEIEEAYKPAGIFEHDWFNRYRHVKILTGVQLAGDGVDYAVSDAGTPDVIHETGEAVLQDLRMTGARLTGVDLRDGNVYYKLTESK
jgi:hypothetical protein